MYRMKLSMYVRMDGWMNGMVNGRTDGWINGFALYIYLIKAVVQQSAAKFRIVHV